MSRCTCHRTVSQIFALPSRTTRASPHEDTAIHLDCKQSGVRAEQRRTVVQLRALNAVDIDLSHS